jgi:hypothetical protein
MKVIFIEGKLGSIYTFQLWLVSFDFSFIFLPFVSTQADGEAQTFHFFPVNLNRIVNLNRTCENESVFMWCSPNPKVDQFHYGKIQKARLSRKLR